MTKKLQHVELLKQPRLSGLTTLAVEVFLGVLNIIKWLTD